MRWRAIALRRVVSQLSHGQRVRRHAVGGAREEGALGFPAVFEVALPQLQATLAQGATGTTPASMPCSP
jgi:triphosphoribosyl-dephospho-CoA synthase